MTSEVVKHRHRLGYNGVILVSLVMNWRGDLIADPQVTLEGLLEGQLEVTTYAEDRQVTEVLRPGDSCYIDASVPHFVRGVTRSPYSQISAEVLDVFWCPLGETYLFAD